MKNITIRFDYKTIIVVLFLIVVIGSLRYINLGYSEYIPDETTVMWPLKHKEFFNLSYLLDQRKGPMQYFTAYLVSIFNVNVYNEFLYRLPFSIINTLAMIVMYFAVRRLTGNKWVPYISVFIFALNGFTVAFGRIIQYQSLNMLFSFLSVFFYTFLVDKKLSYKKYVVYSVLGTVSVLLSVASHWDALFIIPIDLYIWLRFIKFTPIDIKSKKNVVNINALIVIFLIIPFITIYLRAFLTSSDQQQYFTSRIGNVLTSFDGVTSKFDEYSSKFYLYNPFFYLPIVLPLIFLSLFEWKRVKIYWLWTIFIASLFILFVKKPGTHLYNFFIPVSIICGYGYYSFAKLFKKYFAVVPFLITLPVITLLWYQNYLLFVDNKIEYPWQQETVWKYTTYAYTHTSLTNNIIGFPLRRNWVAINKTILADMKDRNISGTFITNEVKSISNFYMDIPYYPGKLEYGIGVKDPFSFEKDYSFPQYHNKTTIGRVDCNGKFTARIYLINNDKLSASKN